MERPETKVTVLPPAGREAQLERWGIAPDRVGDHRDRRGHQADDAVSDADADDADEHALETRGFLTDGGWRLVQAAKGTVRRVDDGGMTSHRGVLHPDEYVDPAALRAAVENALGFTLNEVRSVYRQGPMSDAQRELRGRIDARLLEVSLAGGSMLELARAFDWAVKPASAKGGQSCDTMERALARARKEAS